MHFMMVYIEKGGFHFAYDSELCKGENIGRSL